MAERPVEALDSDESGAVGVRGHRVRDARYARAQRQAILAAAAQVFGEKGYAAATVDEIAALLEVTKPAVYYYFRNKEALYVEVRVAATLAGCARLEELIAEHVSPIDILRATARDLVEGTSDPLNRAATIIDFSDLLGRASVARIRDSQRQYRQILRGVVQQGIEEGSLVEGDANIMTLIFVDALHSIVHWYRDGGRLSREAVVQEVVERVMGIVLPHS